MSGGALTVSYWHLTGAQLREHLNATPPTGSTAVEDPGRTYPTRQVAKTRPAPPHRPSFRGFDDFMPVFTRAKFAAMHEHGPKWWADPDVCIKARLPKAWVTWKGVRGGTCYRDVNMPVARYWPGKLLPVGPEYAAPIRAAVFGTLPIARPVQIEGPAWEWLPDD